MMESELIDVTEWKAYVYDAIVEEVIANGVYYSSDDIDEAADEFCSLICLIMSHPCMYRMLKIDVKRLDELIKFLVVNFA